LCYDITINSILFLKKKATELIQPHLFFNFETLNDFWKIKTNKKRNKVEWFLFCAMHQTVS